MALPVSSVLRVLMPLPPFVRCEVRYKHAPVAEVGGTQTNVYIHLCSIEYTIYVAHIHWLLAYVYLQKLIGSWIICIYAHKGGHIYFYTPRFGMGQWLIVGI